MGDLINGIWRDEELPQEIGRIGDFRRANDYTESLDMPTALHPQTILATKYAGEIIGDLFGYPLRLHTSRLQEREMDQGDRSQQRLSRHLLERARLQLVRRNLVDCGLHIDAGPQYRLSRLRHLHITKELT